MLDAFTWVTDALDNVGETISGLDVTQYMQDAGQDEAPDEEAGEAEEPAEAESESDTEDEDAEEEQGEEEAEESDNSEEEIRVTDAARSKAEELGVDLSGLEGTGLNGIITVSDVTGNGG